MSDQPKARPMEYVQLAIAIIGIGKSLIDMAHRNGHITDEQHAALEQEYIGIYSRIQEMGARGQAGLDAGGK